MEVLVRKVFKLKGHDAHTVNLVAHTARSLVSSKREADGAMLPLMIAASLTTGDPLAVAGVAAVTALAGMPLHADADAKGTRVFEGIMRQRPEVELEPEDEEAEHYAHRGAMLGQFSSVAGTMAPAVITLAAGAPPLIAAGISAAQTVVLAAATHDPEGDRSRLQTAVDYLKVLPLTVGLALPTTSLIENDGSLAASVDDTMFQLGGAALAAHLAVKGAMYVGRKIKRRDAQGVAESSGHGESPATLARGERHNTPNPDPQVGDISVTRQSPYSPQLEELRRRAAEIGRPGGGGPRPPR